MTAVGGGGTVGDAVAVAVGRGVGVGVSVGTGVLVGVSVGGEVGPGVGGTDVADGTGVANPILPRTTGPVERDGCVLMNETNDALTTTSPNPRRVTQMPFGGSAR
jgi:hypothetical protein